MRLILGLLVGVGFGSSLLLAYAAFRPELLVSQIRAGMARSDDGPRFEVDAKRAAVGSLVGVVLLLVTRWPVVAIAGAAAAYTAPSLLAGDGMQNMRSRTEAIATWIESLRDSMAASRGLEGAIRSTAASGPVAIRGELLMLVDEIDGNMQMRDALVRLSDRLDHSVSDMAIATLVMAVDGDAVKINSVLDEVAQTSREMASNMSEVHASRSSARTTTRLTMLLITGLLMLLFVMFRDFLAPYGTPIGQIALGVFLAGFAGCFVWIHRLSKYRPIPRLIRPGGLAR